jgi:hypothetical protein
MSVTAQLRTGGALAVLLALTRERNEGHAGLNRRAPGRSRVRAALLPVRQELGLGRGQARRTSARGYPELRIDVDRDRPEPPQLGLAVPIFIDAPHVAAILNDYVVEPGAIGRG